MPAHTLPPSLADIERLARAAWEEMPSHVRSLAGDVVIAIEEIADDETLDELGLDDPLELTGLYHGEDLTQKSITAPVHAPTMVILYRRAILYEWIAHGDVDLEALVAHVLVHEIGHHFGLSDEDMDKLLEQAD